MPIATLPFDLLAVSASAVVYQVLTGHIQQLELLIVLSVIFVVMSFVLAYQLRATTTLFNALLVFWALVDLSLGTAFDILYVVFDTIINRLIFGSTGRILFASLVLWALGAAITESHDEIFEVVDQFYCEIRPTRELAANIAARLDPVWEIYSCFYNLLVSFGSTAFAVFVELSVNCANSTLWFDILAEIMILLGAIAQAILSWLTVVNSDGVGGPLYNNITIFDPNPDGVDVWKSWVALVDLTTTFDDCLCEDPALQDILDFVYERATADELGCAIHEFVNAGLNIVQATLQIIAETPTRVPNYRLPFQRLCAGIICLGDWFDDLIIAIQDVFVFDVFGEIPIDFKIGCMVSRFLCIWIELASSLVVFSLEILFNCLDVNGGTCSLLDVIADFDLVPVVGRTRELAACVEEVVSLFDVCLGQAAGRFILIFAEVVEFVQRVIADGQYPFENLLLAVNRFVGDSQHDQFENNVSPNLHVEDDDHFDSPGQTSLTCVLARLLGNTVCARATADLANSAVQFAFVPLLITEDLLITDYGGLDFDGSDSNPFSDGNRQAFEDFLLDLLCVVTDRAILLLDSFGHLLQCIDGIDVLGDAVVDLAVAFQNIIEEIKLFFVLAVEVVLQALFWFMTTLGQGPFGNSSQQELLTFFDLFFELLITVFDFVLEILRMLVDYFLFPWFPGIFGQGTLLSSNPGTARFTECFLEFQDCICGVTKLIVEPVCLPLDIGCLANYWPPCGDFNPGKRFVQNGTYAMDENGRIIPDMAPWEYFADQFNDTFCGEVFGRWRDNVQPGMSVGYAEGMEYMNCISMVRTSLELGSNYTGPQDSDIFINPQKLNKTATQFARATSAHGGVALANTLIMYSDPAAILGRPEATTAYIEFADMLERHGIDDRLATMLAGDVRSTATGALEKARALLDSDPDMVDTHMLAKDLVLKTGTLVSHGVSAGVAFWQSVYNDDLVNKMWAGAKQAANTGTEKLRSVPDDRRRGVTQINIYDHDPAQRVMSGYWPYRVSSRELKRQRRRIFFSGLEEAGKHLLGYETVSPKYNLRGELDLEDHIPNSCTRVFTGCSNASQIAGAPTGCAEEFNFLNTRLCQNVFGHAVTVNCGENDLGQLFVSFLFWEKFSDCNRPEPFLPIFEFSQFAGDPPLNETACLDTSTFSPDPDPGSAGIICITRESCAACPVDEIFPDFKCSFVDEFVHREEAATRRCIDKLGVGPIMPQIPENFTVFTLDPFVSVGRVPAFNTRCGNGQVDLVPYNYTNPVTGEFIIFAAEECDPPFRFNTTAGLRCNAACQFTRCGNGITEEFAGEQCDEGDTENRNNNPGRADGLCTPLCTFNECGDGILSFAGECFGDQFNQLNGAACDPLGNGTECGVLECRRVEECDDGNRLANDGCDRFCRAEICPRIITATVRGESIEWTESFGPCFNDTGFPADFYELREEAVTPDHCFLLPLRDEDDPRAVLRSVEVNCKAYDPVLMIYPNDNCDGRNSLQEFEILRECAEQPTRCARAVGDPNNVECLLPVGTGLDFTCTKNCGVCGNNITETGEECDDGTIFPTGDPVLDECVACRQTCTCAVDEDLPCRGFCLGGPRNQRACDPRAADADSCNGVEFPCVAYECCGDGILQASENQTNGGPFCDDNPNPDPANPNNSSCVQCLRTTCQCQPGKPCLGRCVNTDAPLPPNNFYETTCDVRLEPFACPTDAETCLPFSCCGDGELQIFEIGFEDPPPGTPQIFCEPGVSGVGCDDECRYLDSGGEQFCIDGDGNIGPCSLVERRDNCECQPGEPCVGRCFEGNGDDFEFFTFCDRAESLAGNESQCESISPGAVCGSVTCCSDERVSGFEGTGIAFAPCENDIAPQGCPGVDGCNYNNQWYFVDPCSCVPGEACLGRCSFRGGMTETLCDPQDAGFGQSWCPWASDPEYRCWPQGCCGDGTEQLAHGIQNTGGPPGESFRLDPLETAGCDNSSCADDCGLAENVETDNGFSLFVPIFMQCACQPGFECAGYCVQDDTGLADPAFLCNATSGAPNNCDPGETCIPQACCGDNITHYIEGCEATDPGCPTDCNITGLINKRKRDFYIQPLDIHPLAEESLQRRALVDPETTYILAQKTDALTEFIFTIADWVLDQFGFDTAGDIQQAVIDFLGLRGTDIYLPPEERGIEWYLVFPLPGFCRMPANTCCDEGFGALTTLGILLPYTFVAAVVIGVVFGSGITSCMVMLLMMLWFSIFSGMAWFYSFPGCVIPTLRVPECIGRDVSEILNITNTTCLPWPEGVVVAPAGPSDESCNATCTRDILDCRAHGFHDGTDTLVYYLERYWPDAFAEFKNTFIFSFLDGIEYFTLTFDRFDYGGATPPADDHWCYSVTLLNIFQVVAIVVLAGLLVFVTAQIVIRLLSRIFGVAERVEYMYFRFMIANEQQPRLSWPR